MYRKHNGIDLEFTIYIFHDEGRFVQCPYSENPDPIKILPLLNIHIQIFLRLFFDTINATLKSAAYPGLLTDSDATSSSVIDDISTNKTDIVFIFFSLPFPIAVEYKSHLFYRYIVMNTLINMERRNR